MFPANHYKTGKRFGLDSFTSVYSEVAAELALTLPVAQRENGTLSLSKRELMAYHFLHYGAEHSATSGVVELLLGGRRNSPLIDLSVAEKLEELRDMLAGSLQSVDAREALPLGRLSLGAIGMDVKVPEELGRFTEEAIIGDPASWEQRPGVFLHPLEGAYLHYHGSMTGWRADEVIGDNPNLLHELANIGIERSELMLDEIRARTMEGGETFVAVSQNDQEFSYLRSIVPIMPVAETAI